MRVTDRRPGGRTYLVDEGFSSMAELEAVVADYLEKAARRLDYVPMAGWFWMSMTFYALMRNVAASRAETPAGETARTLIL